MFGPERTRTPTMRIHPLPQCGLTARSRLQDEARCRCLASASETGRERNRVLTWPIDPFAAVPFPSAGAAAPIGHVGYWHFCDMARCFNKDRLQPGQLPSAPLLLANVGLACLARGPVWGQ